MADEVQVKILKQGVKAWNQWRKANPKTVPNLDSVDLGRADLREADLHGVDLSGSCLAGAYLNAAYLSDANLTDANLDQADLMGAFLVSARLNRANCYRASLIGANLVKADLDAANLYGADLPWANFTDANLINTDFTNCTMINTQLTRVDLSRCRGLRAVIHEGPSMIGIDTIYRSGGNIPEAFLRGAGVPEPFIVNMKALVAAMSPVEFYSCFISYSSKDQEFAERLHADLRSRNVRCWFAPEDLKIGDRLRTSFDEAIRVHDKLMVLLSENSVQSEWVEKEVETAFERERRENRTILFPLRLDDAVMETRQAWAADIRRTRHIGDFRDWKKHDTYKKALERLLKDLKADSSLRE